MIMNGQANSYILTVITFSFLLACNLEPLPDDINDPSSMTDNTTFVTTDARSTEAVRIVEKDDGFIVFNRSDVYKISKLDGSITGYMDLTASFTDYWFANVLEFADRSMLINSTNEEFTFLDEDLVLSTSDQNTPFGSIYSTFLTADEQVLFIGPLDDNSMIPPILFFWPEGVLPSIFPLIGYKTHTIKQTPYFPPPNHLVSSTKAVFPIIKSGFPRDCAIISYTRSGITDWITDFVNFEPRGMAEMNNGNVLAYGTDNGRTILYTLDGAIGTTLSFETICENDSEVPGDIVRTTDGGFAIVSSVSSGNTNCTSTSINGNNDIRLIKLNQSLGLVWEQVYSITSRQTAYHMIQTSDGGFAIAGRTNLNSIDQFLFIKTDSEGNVTM